MTDPFVDGWEWFRMAIGMPDGIIAAELRNGDVVYRPGQLW